ncbi:unnamed protein product [Closterium sp. Naga37s-1]|nr:unnamed protein product [Closterium sp. Naga37s-1]
MLTAGGMELRLDGVVVKVQRAETAGETAEIVTGTKERAEELEAQVKRQGETMAALKREVDEMRRAMVKGALEMMGAAENHGAGSAAAGEAHDADGLSAQPAAKGEALMALVEAMITARVKDVRDELESQVKGLTEQLEAVKREARDATSEARAVIERQAAEIADVKATAAHIDARMNDVELAVAEWKSARETTRAEHSDGNAGEHAGAEGREGKKRKREVEGDELAEFTGAAGVAADDGDQKRDDGDNSGWEVECEKVKKAVEEVESRVAKLETTSDEFGNDTWHL